MGKPGAYLTIERNEHSIRPAAETVRDFDDFVVDLPRDEQRRQASRCMNCGVAFCQSGMAFNGARQATGCPLHNLIPETNDLLYRGLWDDAAGRLSLTNPFPEFTGRVCPSPCETACNLGLHERSVTIHDNERAISDYLWERGMATLALPHDDAPLISIVGSGPAGLAAAWELARRGLRVRIYERADRPGGLLMYGIPNMKLPKWVVERRIELMKASGIEFSCGVDAASIADDIAAQSQAVVLACGAREPRRVDVPGADLEGVHFAVDYLTEVTRALLDGREAAISAKDKDVVVIGGGDTGVDCVASALRQGARSVQQVIRAACPPASIDVASVWPGPRNVYTQGYGQREAEQLLGSDPRIWSTDTLAFVGGDGAEARSVASVRICNRPDGGDEREIPAQLVLIAKGFVGPEQHVLDAFTPYGNVYCAGDARLGSTLVASAIADGLRAAEEIAAAVDK